jgi:transcriptional regulator with XRE-family HTH domain
MTFTRGRNSVATPSDTLGKRIAEARESKRLSQTDLARAVLPESGRVATVSSWERDKTVPDAKALAGISQTLGVSADWLLFGGERENPVPQIEGRGIALEPIGDEERRTLLRLVHKLQGAIMDGPPKKDVASEPIDPGVEEAMDLRDELTPPTGEAEGDGGQPQKPAVPGQGTGTTGK